MTTSTNLPLPDPGRINELAALLPERRGPDLREERGRWDALRSRDWGGHLVAEAEGYRDTSGPELPDDLYLEFSRTGNRSNYEERDSLRRRRVSVFALAECMENRGRFLAALENDLRAICEQRSWSLPAHDKTLGCFHGTEITIDLCSADWAGALGTVDTWLGDALGAQVREAIRRECRRRVFDVYAKARRDHAFEGRHHWMIGRTNWNAVCTAGVIRGALALIEDRAERAWFLACMEPSLPFFLSGFTEDGYCSEGLAYWNYGFGHYLMLGDAVARATGGRLRIFDAAPEGKLRRIAAYPFGLMIQPGVFPAFADCPVGAQPSGRVLALIERHLPGALPFPAPSDPLADDLHLTRFGTGRDPVPAVPPVADGGEIVLGERQVFPDAGVMIVRSAAGAALAFGAAFKGGTNAEHHNHNDLGSFVVVIDGHPVLVDPGSEVYTARTFGPRRYEGPLLNSYGHAVPVVAGCLQRTGDEAMARMLDESFSGEADRRVLCLRRAYDVPSLERLERTFEYRRDHPAVMVEDRVRFSTPEMFGTALVTYEPVGQAEDGSLTIGRGRHAARVRVLAEGGAWSMRTERLPNPGRTEPTRLGFDFDRPVREARIRFEIRPDRAQGG